ncbi:hypothetical protein L596_012499 [Steinernema carpocapsae]|uniref:G-protein coupled receptors family 1 profile domain-containing protein n=1 Tax=Steinernema carpocapsae TaxID=34508 RepID=A0A4U5NX94_STECR|nr:hypothetical protein L596_012499 [Steinernema carpocapsae]
MFNPRLANAFEPDDYPIVATTFFVAGLCGMAMNLFVIYNLHKRQVFQCAFGRVCMSHSIAALGNNATFALYVAPLTFLNAELNMTYWGKRSGVLIVLFWNAGILSHLLMATNRFVCMYLPLKYSFIFSDRCTRNLVLSAWLLSAIVALLQFIPTCECFVWIDNFNYEWYPNMCGLILGLYADFGVSVSVICLVAVLDFLTYVKIKRYRRNEQRHSVRTPNNNNNSAAQGLAAALEIIMYFYVSPMFDNKWLRFSFSACLFLGVNVIDAIIVTSFNKDIRHQIYVPKKVAPQTSTPITTVSGLPEIVTPVLQRF